jgi:polyhydroxybutyrate depolymerase
MRKRITRFTISTLGFAASLGVLTAVVFRALNRTNGTLVSSGEKRSYLLYVPKTYNPAVATPLVISIHGFAEWPAHQMQVSHWNDLAERHGFIVVYPCGTNFPLRWRTNGPQGGSLDPQRDVTFISNLIDKLESEYNIDPRRIYANGLSNGGGMSFVLSCMLSERIAAVGSVAGAYLFSWDRCQASRPMPMIVFHGTQDPIVPFLGGPSRAFDIPFPPIPEWIDQLARRNGCTAAPLEIPAYKDVSGKRYSACDSNADVVFYTIAGGGHSWPGGGSLPEIIVGRTTQDIDATQAMWDFFVEHPLPQS